MGRRDNGRWLPVLPLAKTGVIPRRLITTWICDPLAGRDAYQEHHHATFYRCLESWHRLMPDYDIRIVSIQNILDYGTDDWIELMIETGNFIGASQWARVHWLDTLGGIYVDMDVEAVQRFDKVLNHHFFIGHEGGDAIANNAIMGSVPNHPFLTAQMAYLHTFRTPKQLRDKQFGNETGPRMTTRLLREKYGWDESDRLQLLDDAVTVYPSPVFYPYFWTGTFSPDCVKPETISIHHWASSWVT